jgi:hypothetical protein
VSSVVTVTVSEKPEVLPSTGESNPEVTTVSDRKDYASEVEPVLTGVCHRTGPQKQARLTFSMLVAGPREILRIEGRWVPPFDGVEESGQPATRRFCPGCSSPIVSCVAAAPELEWIKAGTLDEPSWFEP